MRTKQPTPSIEDSKPPYLPGLLLHGLSLALLLCTFLAGLIYLHSVVLDTISTYRRELNTAASNTQASIERRQAQLRNIAESIAPSDPGATLQSWSRVPSQQVHFYAIANGPGDQTWFLLQTKRDLDELLKLQASIVHSSPLTGITRYVTAPEAALDETQQAWITGFLSSRKPSLRATRDAPLLWLHPPGDSQDRLFLYTQVAPGAPRAGWIGLEVRNPTAILQHSLHTLDMQHLALLNPDQQRVLGNGGDLDKQWLAGIRVQDEDFGLLWNGAWPSTVMIGKPIGETGWRLLYYIPSSQILKKIAPHIYAFGLLLLLVAALILLRMRLLRNRLVLPALKQYQALQEASRLTRAIIETAPVGLCLLRDQDSPPVVSNTLARDWLKQESTRAHLQALTQEGPGGTSEQRLDDGRSVYISIVPMTYHGESAMLCAVNDISMLKTVEQSLLTEKAKADAANKAKTEFLATMSHEIRTPLFGILGSLELLSLTDVTHRQQQYLRTIQFSSSTLLRTINETLDLSQVESGHAQLLVSELAPVDMLYSIVASYADRARAKGILLYGLADAQTPARVEGDELRLRQILNNLVSNAIKFTQGGRVVLRLRVEPADNKAVTLVFQVADTGIGIPLPLQKQLFSPYYQIGAAKQSPDTSGTGLGLYICKRLADMMKGALHIVSAPGLGTSIEFKLVLPVRSPPPPGSLQAVEIYVHGAVPEVVQNLCNWLRQWGATAIAYQPDDEHKAAGAMLLSAWPAAATTPEWHGPRIAMLPPGLIPAEDPQPTAWYCNAFDLQDLLRTLHIAQEQQQPTMPTPATARLVSPLAMCVLAVDDNVINRQVLEEQLALLGCTPTLARNGQEALQRSMHQRIDCILTDINMPDMDGYALARALRQHGYTGPLLGITASTYADELERARAAGMDDLLLRPVSLNALRSALENARPHDTPY